MTLFVAVALGASLATADSAWSAQVGTITTENTLVRIHPNDSAMVIGKLPLDEEIPISNLPTNGFYKMRMDNGDIGWVSGRDLKLPMTNADTGFAMPPRASILKKEFIEDEENSRVIVALGLHTFTYTNMPALLQAEAMNSGNNGLLEFQFRMAKLLYWALRTEVFWSTSSSFLVDTTTAEKVSHFIVPVQLGLHFSPFTFSGFRFGVGAYGGLALLADLGVEQTTPTNVKTATYSAPLSPVGTLNFQIDTGLGENTGLLFETALRFHTTGEFPASQTLPTQIPAFSADYSGLIIRLGIEIRI